MRFALELCSVAWLLSCDRAARLEPLGQPSAGAPNAARAANTQHVAVKGDRDATSEQEVGPEALSEMGRRETEITRGASRIVLTVDDVCAIEASLARAVEASELEDRGYLLPISRGWIDADGTVRIGAWVLGPSSDPLTLTIRVPGLDTAPAIKTLPWLTMTRGTWSES